jgi:HemK-related putative methylase
MFNNSSLLYSLYKLFLKGEELEREFILKIFDKKKIEILINEAILFKTENGYSSNYRIVPIAEHFIICSPPFEFDTPQYVYLGEDSIVFRDLLRKELKETVNHALEIGCGTGLLSLLMSQVAKDVTAVDINQRALELTKLNAVINGFNNINTYISDIYSNIDGKFDLIISNPPYVFLPDECSGRTFAFGGNLGIDILEKILLGLDKHLKDNGICYLIFFSYIKENQTNTAYELIKKLFVDKHYHITLQQIDYHPLKSHPQFYKQHGISHSIRYFVKIQKGINHKFSHIALRGIKKFSEQIKLIL